MVYIIDPFHEVGYPFLYILYRPIMTHMDIMKHHGE